jgi:hypothetical protein
MQLQAIFNPIGANILNSRVLNSFQQIQNLLALLQMTMNLLIRNKIKGTVNKIINKDRTLSLPRPTKPYHLDRIIISSLSPFKFPSVTSYSGLLNMKNIYCMYVQYTEYTVRSFYY